MKSISLFFFLGLFSIHAFSQKDAREGYVPISPIIIDADPSEWAVDWLLDQDGKFLYNIGNDETNLYFRIKISDDLTQQKIALFGLNLKLNAEGKKKGRVGLKYPVGKDARQLKKAPEPLPQDAASKVIAKKQLLDEVEILELIGLAKDNIVSSRLGLMNGIEVLIVASEDGSYIYEAKIPFKAFKINKSSTPILGVTIETGKPNLANNSTSPPAGNQQTSARGFGQTSYSQYNPIMTPAYMWIAVKLK